VATRKALDRRNGNNTGGGEGHGKPGTILKVLEVKAVINKRVKGQRLLLSNFWLNITSKSEQRVLIKQTMLSHLEHL
jgi:hypothetical protein